MQICGARSARRRLCTTPTASPLTDTEFSGDHGDCRALGVTVKRDRVTLELVGIIFPCHRVGSSRFPQEQPGIKRVQHTGVRPTEFLNAHLHPTGAAKTSFGGMVALVDGTIHHQDIRRPLDRPRTIPAPRLRRVLQFVPTSQVHNGRRIARATAAPRYHGNGVPSSTLWSATSTRPAKAFTAAPRILPGDCPRWPSEIRGVPLIRQ